LVKFAYSIKYMNSDVHQLWIRQSRIRQCRIRQCSIWIFWIRQCSIWIKLKRL